MFEGIRLGQIPEQYYPDYRYDVIFNAYKWDPQVGDQNTVADQVLLLDGKTAEYLKHKAGALAKETVQLEEALALNLPLVKELNLPWKIYRNLKYLSHYGSQHNVRLMRFDFHPTTTGWAISEVNSDVPGGLAEGAVLPQVAAEYFPGYSQSENIGEHLLRGFKKLVPGGNIAFVHATAYSDDRQVMQYINDYYAENGYSTMFAGPDHLCWQNRRAISILEGYEKKVDGIVRFFPLEWLSNLSSRSGWQGYYSSLTPSCNHPISILTQSKRLPLVWDQLAVAVPAWQEMLPETKDVKAIRDDTEQWIFKPALGRVGEGISIKGTMSPGEYRRILRAVKRNPKSWVAQRMFQSQPLLTEKGEAYHLCVGVFTVDGKCAGFYGRISQGARIDANAKEIPVLVEKGR
ncbi:MAG: glutathionylspermidine synthase family protein [Lachnospiraceae bacterium]